MKESQRLSLHSGAAMADLNPRFIVAARTVEQAIEIALKRAENQAFVLDGTPRRAA